MADAILRWVSAAYRGGGGYWTVEVLNPKLRDNTPLYAQPPKLDPLEARRRDYIAVLVSALEKRFEAGELDEELADHIEKLLGVGKPDPAGEAEYASWLTAAPKEQPQ